MSHNHKKFADRAFHLIKELDRSSHTIPAFEDDSVRQVLEEIKAIFKENCALAAIYSTTADRAMLPLLNYRHAALLRNKRCLLVYLYQRLQRIKTLRWEFGALLPEDIRSSLCEPEIKFFKIYSKNLSTYMQSIGDGQGINLAGDLRPPKSLYIEVRCVEDYGKLFLDDGEVIFLKKNSQHYLPRSQVESLIRQGILQHLQ